MNKKLLVVEDAKDQQRYAQEQLNIPGLKIDFAENFMQAQDLLKETGYDGVLTDLYFPIGTGADSSEVESVHRERFIPAVKKYVEGLEVPSFALAAEQVTGMACADNLEKIITTIRGAGMTLTKKDEEVLRRSADQRAKIIEYDGLRDSMQNGYSLLPNGIAVQDIAREKGIPVCIVTSEYHHGKKFEPFRQMIGQYVEEVDTSKAKKWLEGYRKLT